MSPSVVLVCRICGWPRWAHESGDWFPEEHPTVADVVEYLDGICNTPNCGNIGVSGACAVHAEDSA